MTKFSKNIQVNASQQKVWEVMSNLGDIYKFNPNVSKSFYNGDQKSGIGASRTCELIPAGIVEEVATKWNEGQSYTLEIIPIEKAPPLKNFYVHLDLTTVSKGITNVDVTMEYDTKLGAIGTIMNTLMIKSQLEKAITLLLDGLKLNLETGQEIENPKTLKALLQAA
ncbi:MAG: SRPBCC family protein [Cyclobacteriaceae bacterium]